VVLAALAVVWVLGLAVGFNALWAYSRAPGARNTTPEVWPRESRVRHEAGRTTLVMALHPKCPCSRASASELRKLADHFRGRVDATVLFARPAGVEAGWEKTQLWSDIASIPGVVPWVDVDGVEAARFGALTSGQLLLYDGEGHLVFSGGITAIRGHEGDNVGTESVGSLLDGGTPAERSTPVYGCPLSSRECRADLSPRGASGAAGFASRTSERP
jgi:hypothetical protein